MVTNRNTLALVFCLLSSLTAGAQNQQPAKRASAIEPLPRDLEIQLALSSLPAHLRDDATVYVLNLDKGFEVVRKGTNGFHALVARTGDDAMRGSWPLTEYPDDILYPISWDQAGATAQLRVFLDIAEMQAKATPPQEVKRIIQQRYRTKGLQSARAGWCLVHVIPGIEDVHESRGERKRGDQQHPSRDALRTKRVQ